MRFSRQVVKVKREISSSGNAQYFINDIINLTLVQAFVPMEFKILI